ncbi:MAG TPA: hypothetical protein VJT81_01190 [Burkholderiales bacterium]|nr:hypothetical protein [Burkholderiales bacterium]
MKKLFLALLFAGAAGCVPPPARVDVPLTEALDKAYTVDLPVGWIRHFAQDKTLLASRDGFTLQTIGITHLPAEQAFPKTKKSVTEGVLPSELAELQIAEMKAETQQMAALVVIENEPAVLDGRDGFRVRVSYHTARGLEVHRVTYGVPDKSGYYRIEYVAPKLYYFDATFADFEKVVSSMRIAGGGKVAAK